MLGWRKSKLEPAADPFDETYTGGTPAHEAGRCLRHGMTQFVQTLSFPGLYVPEGSEKTYVDYLAEARRWWKRARWDEFGLIARWVLTRELRLSLPLLSGWTEYRPEDPRVAEVGAVWSALRQLSDDLYTRHDHWLRLYSQGLIGEARLLEQLARLDPPKPDRAAVVAADLKKLYEAMRRVRQT